MYQKIRAYLWCDKILNNEKDTISFNRTFAINFNQD
jgi:hypothetical protein